MKKIFLTVLCFLLLLPSLSYGQPSCTPSYTTNYHLYKPCYGQSGSQWWGPFISNFDTIDAAIAAGNGGGGNMTWPTGSAGIPNYGGANAWGTTYNASNKIPFNFLTGVQATITNPVTGPGSGATNGHIALIGNTSGTSITDSGHALTEYQTSLTFSQSIANSSGTVTLTGDSATPGAMKVYSTDASSNRGWNEQTSINTAVFPITGSLAAGNNVMNPLIMPWSGNFVKAKAHCGTAPLSTAAIIQLELNGTNIWTTSPDHRLTIAASNSNAATNTFDVTSFNENDILSIDVVAAGGTAGANCTIEVLTSTTINVSGQGGANGIGGSLGTVANVIPMSYQTGGYTLQASPMNISAGGSPNIPTGQNYQINGANLNFSNLAGTAAVSQGGTGVISWTQYGLLYATTSGSIGQFTPNSAGYVHYDGAGGYGIAAGTGATTPGGAANFIQFNYAGTFGGDSKLTWDYTNSIMNLGGDFVAHSLVTDATTWNPKFIIKEGVSTPLWPQYSDWHPHTVYLLNTLSNQSKTAIYIEAMHSVTSAANETSTGILVNHYSARAFNNEWSGITSIEWGGGNGMTSQIRDDYGAASFPTGLPSPTVDRYHGFAHEVDVFGNRTGLIIYGLAGARTGSLANGQSAAIGVGKDTGAEALRIWPVTTANLINTNAIHVTPTANDLDSSAYTFKVRMDGTVFMSNNTPLVIKDVGGVERNVFYLSNDAAPGSLIIGLEASGMRININGSMCTLSRGTVGGIANVVQCN